MKLICTTISPFVLALTFALAPAPLRAQAPEAPATAELDDRGLGDGERRGEALLERVVFVGASVTDGFGLLGEVRAKVDLGDFLGAMFESGRRPAACFGDSWFFRSPVERGEGMIERVVEEEPTLVIAVDFLFWFGYGYGRSESRRLELLDYGLSLLERLDCPLVIGDFPDVQRALKGKGPFGQPMISRPMIPRPETLVKLNERVHAWATERGNVVIAPMAEVLAKINAGEAFEVRGNSFESADADGLLQADLLHLTSEGTIGLLMLAVDGLVRDQGVPAEAFAWDVAVVRERLWAATEEERAKNEEKDRRRAERRNRSQAAGEDR